MLKKSRYNFQKPKSDFVEPDFLYKLPPECRKNAKVFQELQGIGVFYTYETEKGELGKIMISNTGSVHHFHITSTKENENTQIEDARITLTSIKEEKTALELVCEKTKQIVEFTISSEPLKKEVANIIQFPINQIPQECMSQEKKTLSVSDFLNQFPSDWRGCIEKENEQGELAKIGIVYKCKKTKGTQRCRFLVLNNGDLINLGIIARVKNDSNLELNRLQSLEEIQKKIQQGTQEEKSQELLITPKKRGRPKKITTQNVTIEPKEKIRKTREKKIKIMSNPTSIKEVYEKTKQSTKKILEIKTGIEKKIITQTHDLQITDNEKDELYLEEGLELDDMIVGGDDLLTKNDTIDLEEPFIDYFERDESIIDNEDGKNKYGNEKGFNVDNTSMYFNDIRKFGLINKEDEIRLGEEIQLFVKKEDEIFYSVLDGSLLFISNEKIDKLIRKSRNIKEKLGDTKLDYEIISLKKKKFFKGLKNGEIQLLLDENKMVEFLKIRKIGEKAIEDLTNANLRLVVNIANWYSRKVFSLSLIDLIQEGNLGLFRAVRKFDSTQGYKFSTYAKYWIRQAIGRSIIDKGYQIRIPVHENDNIGKFMKVKTILTQKLCREPNIEELSQGLGIEKKEVMKRMKIIYESNLLSLDYQVGEDKSDSFGNFVADTKVPIPGDDIDKGKLKAVIGMILEELNPREKSIMILRNGLNGNNEHTLEEVGEQFGVSRERIRQIEEKAIGKLKCKLRLKNINIKDYLD